MAVYVLLIAAIFPSIESSKELDDLMKSYPEPLKELFGIGAGSITSGPGYLDAELFSFMLPLFVLVLAIGSGARAFAGEEDAGRLELVLSYPVRVLSSFWWIGSGPLQNGARGWGVLVVAAAALAVLAAATVLVERRDLKVP